jgi:hypothetical protein
VALCWGVRLSVSMHVHGNKRFVQTILHVILRAQT